MKHELARLYGEPSIRKVAQAGRVRCEDAGQQPHQVGFHFQSGRYKTKRIAAFTVAGPSGAEPG